MLLMGPGVNTNPTVLVEEVLSIGDGVPA